MSSLAMNDLDKTALVQVEAVSKRFAPSLSLGDRISAALGTPIETRTVHAVDAVSLEIRQGEVLGLVGESGCGKSTLGRVIAGIHPPSSGRAMLAGQSVMASGRTGFSRLGNSGTPLKTTTRIQMVFQDPFASLDPRIRIGDTISEGPIAHGLVRKADAKAYVTTWLEAVGLPPEAAERFPHQFSGGQRQRVAIARALAMQPDVLVCDEPVASLDVSIQAQIINLFLKLRREMGVTMLFISHDLGVVRHICDRVAIMYLGRIVEIGPAPEIFAAPRHPYTRALLDSVPKLVTGSDELVTFKPIQGELPSPLSPPSGCHFHLRCPKAQGICKVDVPQLALPESGPHQVGHSGSITQANAVACHFPIVG